MSQDAAEHTLEFLLDFDGRYHWYEGGYYLKFEMKRIAPTGLRPHGLRYSFTLHDRSGTRLIGFDNAHALRARRTQGRKSEPPADHWHRGELDPGRPYKFQDAETLLQDFFSEVERLLNERGIPLDNVTHVDEGT
jgi:hypothetical protein